MRGFLGADLPRAATASYRLRFEAPAVDPQVAPLADLHVIATQAEMDVGADGRIGDCTVTVPDASGSYAADPCSFARALSRFAPDRTGAARRQRVTFDFVANWAR